MTVEKPQTNLDLTEINAAMKHRRKLYREHQMLELREVLHDGNRMSALLLIDGLLAEKHIAAKTLREVLHLASLMPKSEIAEYMQSSIKSTLEAIE
jgi:hypothetical protein